MQLVQSWVRKEASGHYTICGKKHSRSVSCCKPQRKAWAQCPWSLSTQVCSNQQHHVASGPHNPHQMLQTNTFECVAEATASAAPATAAKAQLLLDLAARKPQEGQYASWMLPLAANALLNAAPPAAPHLWLQVLPTSAVFTQALLVWRALHVVLYCCLLSLSFLSPRVVGDKACSCSARHCSATPFFVQPTTLSLSQHMSSSLVCVALIRCAALLC